MSAWRDEVHDLYERIQSLPRRWRQELWRILAGAFPRVLDDTDPAPDEVWDDPRNGFGRPERKLLDFLADWGVRTELQVVKHLWPDEWTPDLAVEAKLRNRLRKME